jgi:hypothetical protein
MAELERRLRAAEVEWPETPDVAAAVVARVEGGAERRGSAERSGFGERRGSAERGGFGRRRRFAARPRRLGAAVALALLVPSGAALAVAPVREEVLDFFGVRGAEVRRAERLPPAEPVTRPGLGDAVTLDEATRRAGFRPLVPSRLGPPGEVRFERASRFVTLVYGDLLIAQSSGALDAGILQKIVGVGTGVRSVRIDGWPGFFVDREHAYLYAGTPGPRASGPALVFNRGDLLIRIQRDRLTLDEAVAIAQSMRP